MSSSLLSGHSNPLSISKLSDRDSVGISTSDSRNDPLLSNDVAERDASMPLPIYNKREVLPPPPHQRGIYQATCDPLLIPDIAKDMKWHDPHFNIHNYSISNSDNNSNSNNSNNSNNNNNIIAVFDMDHNTINRYSFDGWFVYVCAWWWFFQLSDDISNILPNALSSNAREYISFAIAIVIVIVLVDVAYKFRQRITRYKNIHIAIATDGIYIDERNTNRHHHPLQYDRTIIPYEQIDKCYIHSYQFWCRNYMHVTFLGKNGQKINRLLVCFHHLHLFVDLVNEMMAKSSSSINTTSSIQNDTTHPHNDNETEAASIV